MDSHETIGKVKGALVFGRDPSAKGFVLDISACRVKLKDRRRVHFAGAVQFSDPLKRHVRSILVPIVDRILSAVQLPAWGFELSATNLGAASALDVGVRISGFSADVALFVALFSAGLQIPVAEDFVATGHIASTDGQIRAVRGLPAKVRAAEEDDAIHRFVHPDLEEDRSMKTLSPAERERGIAAVKGVRDSLKTRAVRGVDEVVKEVFTEENIVLTSLKEGFYCIISTECDCGSPVARAVSLLTQDHNQRFWHALERCLVAGECERGKRLLKALVDFLVARQRYDSGIGTKLLNLMRSLPPAVRRLKIEFPLLDTAQCLKLGEFAARADHSDVLRLLDAVRGKGIALAEDLGSTDRLPIVSTPDSDYAAFDTVVAQINEQALARRFGIRIDSARGSYIMDSSTVQSWDEFHEVLDAFYIHLHRWISGCPEESLDTGYVRTEVIELLETAFHNHGGAEAAYARARDGTAGGMRSVLDAVAEHYKRQRYADHVRRVFQEAVSALDWSERVGFMRGALKHLGPFLPQDLKDEPPERFARRYEVIVQTYVESLDRLGQLFRTL